MTIAEAIEAVSDEYDQECLYAGKVAAFDALLKQTLGEEYAQIDQHLPSYVADIAKAMGAPVGTELPPCLYQMARMCFRLGMRVQRKMDTPETDTTAFWQQSGMAQ